MRISPYTNTDWKELPRSHRLEYNGLAADVWGFLTVNNGIRYYAKYTIFDTIAGVYIDGGNSLNIDEACEYCEKFMQVI